MRVFRLGQFFSHGSPAVAADCRFLTPLLSISVWLPTELWVDAFKLLSRRNLARRVQLTCKRFYTIVECHVDNVHIIRNFGRFLRRFERNLPEARKQLEDLKAEPRLPNCFQLSGDVHFYLSTTNEAFFRFYTSFNISQSAEEGGGG